METNWNLGLQLTLENACFIAIAKSLWNQADVKIKIESSYRRHIKFRTDWHLIESHVLSKVDKIGLFGSLKSELELVIILLGDKIQGWFDYFANGLRLDISYARNISWTTIGTIDKINVPFQLKLPVGDEDGLWTAWKFVIDMEEARCSYLQMNEADQQKNVLHFIAKLYDLQVDIHGHFSGADNDFFEDALILATNKLSENDMEIFVKEHPAAILSFYLLNYGFQNLFHLIFHNVREFLTLDDYHNIIWAISLREDFNQSKKCTATDIRENFVKSAFIRFWTEIPMEIKKEIILGSHVWANLVIAHDTVIWKLIYNDKNLECYKKDIHICFKEGFSEELHYTGDYNLLKHSNIDPIKVKNFFESIFHEYDIYSADLLAFFYSEEEMTNFKSQLDSNIICNHFIKETEWDCIDEYLKWRFDSEREVEVFKNQYKTNDFIYETLIDIWDDLDEVTAFLLWLFESEENVVKYKMENPGMAEKVIKGLNFNTLKKTESFLQLEAFMKCWSLSSEHLSSIKENILKCDD